MSQTSPEERPRIVDALFDYNPSAIAAEIEAGASPDTTYFGMSLVWLASYNGLPDVLEVLVNAGAPVPKDALSALGEMDVTDWKIDNPEEELAFARVAEILLANGASPDVLAYNGKPLVSTFPLPFYRNLHRILSEALRQARPHF